MLIDGSAAVCGFPLNMNLFRLPINIKASEIDENEYFSRLIGEDITQIAKDIKEKHRKDKETGEDNNPLTDVIDVVKEYALATDPMKVTLSTLSKQLGMNFSKMDPAEIQFFTAMVEKYSTVYKSMLPKNGRGKTKKNSEIAYYRAS